MFSRFVSKDDDGEVAGWLRRRSRPCCLSSLVTSAGMRMRTWYALRGGEGQINPSSIFSPIVKNFGTTVPCLLTHLLTLIK